MNVFDIIGPIMIGPSSSHTAGAVRLGQIARKILGEDVVQARIELSGSFARTYRGHGTDKALLAGIMGLCPDDTRIRCSPQLAQEKGISFSFLETELPDAHPNTARIHLTGERGKTTTIVGTSTGGGNILVTEIDGLKVTFTAQCNTLLVVQWDRPGTLAAVSNYTATSGINIGNFQLSRTRKGGKAIMMLEIDGEVPDAIMDHLRAFDNIIDIILIRVG